MLKNFRAFLTLLILAAGTGCQKEPTEQIPAPASPKLEKITEGDEMILFTYNTDGSLKEAQLKDPLASGDDPVTYRIAYSTPGKIREVITDDGRKIVPVYEGNLITEASIRNALDRPVAGTEYTYLNGMLKSATLSFENGTQPVPWLKYIFNYDAGGNVRQTQLLVNDFLTNQLVPAGQVQYEYDNRLNPLLPLKDFLLLTWQTVSPNNIKKEIHVGPLNSIDETGEYTYTYTTRNLPQRAEVRKTVTGQPTENQKREFTYR